MQQPGSKAKKRTGKGADRQCECVGRKGNRRASITFFGGFMPGARKPDDSQRARVTLALGYRRPPHSRPMASSPMRRLRKTGAVDQDGNVVTGPTSRPAGTDGVTPRGSSICSA
jgi:hypothetical protein